jgi:hypothetical protein
MANILLNLEHGVEVGAADVLRFLTAAQSTATKLEPGVIAAFGVLLGTLEKTMTDLSQAAASPLNISLDATTVGDLRAVWPQVAAFSASLGIKF